MFSLSKTQLVSLVLFAVFVFSVAFVAEARQLELNYPSIPGAGGSLTLGPEIHNTSLPDLLVYLYTFFVTIAGLIAFASFVVAGFLFMTSGANPALRNQAKNRIQQAVLGLALLLGAYIILSVINPELVLLHAPTVRPDLTATPTLAEPSGVLDEVDYETLRYGGVVIFEDDNIDGSSGRSEVVLHDIAQLTNESYLAEGSGQIKAFKALGNCTFEFTDEDFIFTDTSCLGHSVKVYESINYNENAPFVQEGTLLFLTNDFDWEDRDFVQSAPTRKLRGNVSSMRFAFSEEDPRIPEPLQVSLCNKKGYAGDCLALSSSTSSLYSAFNNMGSSLRFDSAKYRQAGVLLYEEPGFEGGRQEVFIASDKNLNPSFVKNDHLSALKIIGQYRVTLYGDENFGQGEGWIQFDNSDPENPTYSRCTQGITNPCSREVEGASLDTGGGILEIPSLDDTSRYCYKFKDDDPDKDCEESFNDKITSIKIEVPLDIGNRILPPGTLCFGDPLFCEL